MRALPVAYRDVRGTLVVHVDERAWTVKDGELFRGSDDRAEARVRMTADAAWRLFYNAPARVEVSGDRQLAAPLLGARSVIV